MLPSLSASDLEPIRFMRRLRYILIWFVLTTLLLGGALLPSAHAQNQPITATDLLHIRQLDDVRVSPDGRHVTYTVKQIVETTKAERPYAYRTHLYYLSAGRQAQPRPLTRGERSASQPAWHPESDRLAFVRSVDGTPQIFMLPLTGGEPIQITDYEHGATNPRWAPGGDRLLFSARVPASAVRAMMDRGPEWDDERPGRRPQDTTLTTPPDTLFILRDSLTRAPLDTLAFDTPASTLALFADSLAAFPDTATVPPANPPATSANPEGSLLQIRKWLAERRQDDNPRVFHGLDFQGEHDLQAKRSYRHLFVIGVDEDGATSESQAVTRGFYDFGGARWLPNGTQILTTAAPYPEHHPDRTRRSDLFLIDPGSHRRTRLLRLQDHAIYAPRITPDGTTVAFLTRDLDDPAYAQPEIGLFPIDGRTPPRFITTDFDRAPRQLRWSPDGWYLYFTAASEGSFPLYRTAPFARDTTAAEADPPTQEAISGDTFVVDSTLFRPSSISRLTGPAQGVRNYDVTTASAYYVLTEATNPYELYRNNAEFGRAQRISSHNASWLADKRLSTPEPFTVQSDSFQIDGWVMPPAPQADTLQYPLLVQMHGGPAAMWGPGEATMWHEFQFLAAQGLGIVYSNPRGSGGYGRDFEAANYQNWGTGPMNDVLRAADHAIANHAWIDTTRQVLTGGSYAGYLTAWMVSQTNRFDAAVAQRGVYDLPTFLGEGNAWRLVPEHFGGYPWQGDRPAPIGVADSVWAARDTVAADTARGIVPREALLRNSPLTYVDQIRTPLLIMHADNDLRTGVSQSEMLYKSLKILERPVEYVRYPEAGHDLSRSGDPEQRIDRLLRIYEFMARFTDEAKPASRPGPSTR